MTNNIETPSGWDNYIAGCLQHFQDSCEKCKICIHDTNVEWRDGTQAGIQEKEENQERGG